MTSTPTPVPEELRSLLCCPVCRGELDFQPEVFTCRGCGRNYPVRQGIPDLVPPADEEIPAKG